MTWLPIVYHALLNEQLCHFEYGCYEHECTRPFYGQMQSCKSGMSVPYGEIFEKLPDCLQSSTAVYESPGCSTFSPVLVLCL